MFCDFIAITDQAHNTSRWSALARTPETLKLKTKRQSEQALNVQLKLPCTSKKYLNRAFLMETCFEIDLSSQDVSSANKHL